MLVNKRGETGADFAKGVEGLEYGEANASDPSRTRHAIPEPGEAPPTILGLKIGDPIVTCEIEAETTVPLAPRSGAA